MADKLVDNIIFMADKEVIKTENNERQQNTEGIHPFLQRPRSACRLGRDTIRYKTDVLDTEGILPQGVAGLILCYALLGLQPVLESHAKLQ